MGTPDRMFGPQEMSIESGQTNCTNNPAHDCNPAWSSDRTKLAFALFSFISVFMIALVSLSPTQAAAAGQWTLTGSTAVPHGDLPMTKLLDGRVITTGTDDPPTMAVAEIYDEQTGHWSQTGSANLGRRQSVPVTLNDGRVLIAGGLAGGAGASETNAAEIYDPTTGTWPYTGSLNQGRTGAIYWVAA